MTQALKVQVGDTIAGQAGTVDAVHRFGNTVLVHFDDGHTKRYVNSQHV